MGYNEAFAPIEQHNKAVVMINTWGHLAPKRQKKHKGFVLFTCTAYGQTYNIDNEFETVEDSPFFFEDMENYIHNYSNELPKNSYGIFKFEGHYIKFKNGNGRFTGKVTKIEY